jgi:serine/threonine-protein kinase
VHIAVPPGTPVGKYSFRLNIISVENPDDEFTEGPSVSFEVKEVTVAQAPARKFPWWIVAVAAVVVLGAGIITWLLIPQKISVPNIVGEDISKAKVLLKDTRLRLRTEPKFAGEKPGTIVDQNPKKDERVAPGTIITAFVEPEMVTVPGLIGQSPAEVEPILKKAQLQLKTEAKSAGATPGTIVDQNPKKDARVAPGTVVTAFVQPEPEMVTVPDVIGVPADKVGSIFEVKKLQYYVIGQRIITGKVPVGAIAHQSPEKDQRVRVGTRVELAAEAESVVVPDLRGTLFFEAGGKLPENLKLQLDIGAQPIGKQTRVGSQSPQPGTRVAPYSTVAVRPD